MRPDGTIFNDKDIHRILERKGFKHLFENEDEKNEWFKCSVDEVRQAILELKEGIITDSPRIENFKMRPEQFRGVERTLDYYKKAKVEEPYKAPKFLWNCKMRYGKTFASYQLAKKSGFKRILILTFKPAVESSWREDLETHIDFKNWQFISNIDATGIKVNISQEFEQADKNKPIVVFGSFQDLLGKNSQGGIKAKNEFIHSTNWDLVIFDEYHFGSWRESAQKLFETKNEEDIDFDLDKYQKEEAANAFNESFLPITTDYYLYLSGTPFRILNRGEFIEEQIYNWTYADEQRAKNEWLGKNNPYTALPRMILMTYKIPDNIKKIAEKGEFNEFDLNKFFSAEGEDAKAHFIFENEVQKWLDLIRGAYLPSKEKELKLGDNVPPMPYSDSRLLNILSHTLWFLPNVASCQAMFNLLQKRQNDWFNQNYNIIVAAGPKAGIGLEALKPVRKAMGDPLKTKTITLSCGKLTTGVTVKPWSGVFMLRNLKSPETYFQTAFRAQSPWEITDEFGNKHILKKECYVFDFALDRALKQISDYSCKLDVSDASPEEKINEFINFLPVLAYDGSKMIQVNAEDILDFATVGTSATLLARRWESSLLVNVDNLTLTKLKNNKEAMEALMKIEGFRKLNEEIETIINKSETVKKARNEETSKSNKAITKEEKDLKNLRKEIQEKLIKFATRIPIFMYLTDYREKSLQDIILKLEPDLFKKVTGLRVKDFQLLCDLGVFNSSLLNDAIFKFKRYEDSSLVYTGINRHENKDVGGWDVILKRKEFDKNYNTNQTPIAQNDLEKNYQNINKSYHKVQPSSVQEEIKNEIEFSFNKISIGKKVKHKLFKVGVITKLDKSGKHFCVTFNEGEKKFAFPNAFIDGFLELINE